MKRLILACTFSIFAIVSAKAASVTLTWTPPTTRTDSSALAATSIAGADIFDSCPCIPPVPVPQPIGTVIGATGTFKTGQLAPGAHTFTVITRDTSTPNVASGPSNPVILTIVIPPPAAITNLTGTIGP